jgi:hypothetical protein
MSPHSSRKRSRSWQPSWETSVDNSVSQCVALIDLVNRSTPSRRIFRCFRRKTCVCADSYARIDLRPIVIRRHRHEWETMTISFARSSVRSAQWLGVQTDSMSLHWERTMPATTSGGTDPNGAVGRSWGIIRFLLRFPQCPGVPIGWTFSVLRRTKMLACINGGTAVAGEDGSLSEES